MSNESFSLFFYLFCLKKYNAFKLTPEDVKMTKKKCMAIRKHVRLNAFKCSEKTDFIKKLWAAVKSKTRTPTTNNDLFVLY